MDIDFGRYFVKDADEFREGYENSLKLVAELRTIKEFKELFLYKGMDISEIAQHNFAVYFAKLMNELQYEKSSIFNSIVKDFKFKLKKFLRWIKKEKLEEVESSKRKKAVIILYSSSQTDTIFPVIKQLKARDKIDLKIISGDIYSRKKLDKEGIKYALFDSYTEDKIIEIRKLEKIRFNELWKEIVKNKIIYQGKDILKSAKREFFNNFIETIEQYETINNLLNIEKPDILVTATDMSIRGKTDIFIAKQKKIPCIVSQHGAAIDVAYYQPTIADKFVVWGNITRDMLIRRGYDKDKIFVAGSTKYDGIKFSETKKAEFILIATQMVSLNEQKKFLDAVFPACTKIKEEVKINLHPGQKPALIKHYLKKYGLEAEIIPGQPPQGINYFVSECKLLITICSTIAIDAIIMGKPVVSVNLSGKKELIPYSEKGVSMGVEKSEEVLDAMKKALYDKDFKKTMKINRENFLKEYIGPNDGAASLKFAELIESMV